MEILTEKDFTAPVVNKPQPKVVKFTNDTKQDFTWTWNGIPYTFPAGTHKYMEVALAKHFAKHLVNRELLKRGRENDTSPKVMEENPFFMELYNRFVTSVDTGSGPTDKTKLEQDIIDKNMRSQLGEDTQEPQINQPQIADAPAPQIGDIPVNDEQGGIEPAAPASNPAPGESEFEDLPVDDEDDTAPPAEPSNMAAKGAKKAGRPKKVITI